MPLCYYFLSLVPPAMAREQPRNAAVAQAAPGDRGGSRWPRQLQVAQPYRTAGRWSPRWLRCSVCWTAHPCPPPPPGTGTRPCSEPPPSVSAGTTAGAGSDTPASPQAPKAAAGRSRPLGPRVARYLCEHLPLLPARRHGRPHHRPPPPLPAPPPFRAPPRALGGGARPPRLQRRQHHGTPVLLRNRQKRYLKVKVIFYLTQIFNEWLSSYLSRNIHG